MAFFGSKPKPESAPAIHSLLGKEVLFKGEVHTNTRSFRVEGVVEGTIHSTGEVSIAPGGLVKGTIFAKHLIVTGRAEGIMKITETIRTTSVASVMPVLARAHADRAPTRVATRTLR